MDEAVRTPTLRCSTSRSPQLIPPLSPGAILFVLVHNMQAHTLCAHANSYPAAAAAAAERGRGGRCLCRVRRRVRSACSCRQDVCEGRRRREIWYCRLLQPTLPSPTYHPRIFTCTIQLVHTYVNRNKHAPHHRISRSSFEGINHRKATGEPNRRAARARGGGGGRGGVNGNRKAAKVHRPLLTSSAGAIAQP